MVVKGWCLEIGGDREDRLLRNKIWPEKWERQPGGYWKKSLPVWGQILRGSKFVWQARGHQLEDCQCAKFLPSKRNRWYRGVRDDNWSDLERNRIRAQGVQWRSRESWRDFFPFIISLCVCGRGAQSHHCVQGRDKEQLAGIHSLLPPRRLLGSSSDHSSEWQAPLLRELAH